MGVKIREKDLTNGDIALYLEYNWQGDRWYESLNMRLTKDKTRNREVNALAEQVRNQKELELQTLPFGLSSQVKRKLNFVDYFFEKVSTKKYNYWPAVVKHLNDYVGNYLPIGQVTYDWIEGFRNYLVEIVSANTAHLYFTVFKVVINIAIKEGILNYDPSKGVTPIRRQNANRAFLTDDELNTLAQTPCKSPELKRAFLFACFTGLRGSDIRNLKHADIVKDTIQIRIQKTDTLEYIPLHEEALNLLNQKKVETIDRVFDMPPTNTQKTYLRQWTKDAGISKNITFHSARHTYATMLIKQGVRLEVVSKLLGHKDLKTTLIYAKIIDETKVEAVNRLPKLRIAQ